MRWSKGELRLGEGETLAISDSGGPDEADEAVIFVNGLGVARRAWGAVAGHLLGSYRLVSYDMRATGRTRLRTSADDYETLLGDLSRVREYVAGPSVLVGWSFGAQLAVESAASDPRGCTAVLAVDGGFPFDRQSVEVPAADPTGPRLLRGIGKLLGVGCDLTADQLRRLTTEMERREHDMDRVWDDLSCPATLLFGTRLSQGPQAAELHAAATDGVRRFEERHPDVQVLRVDSDHMIPLRQPDAIVTPLVELLRRSNAK